MKRMISLSILTGLLVLLVGCDSNKSSAPATFSPPPQGVQSDDGGKNKGGEKKAEDDALKP